MWKVVDIEIKNGEMIPTYFLMKELEEQNKESELYFIIGSDLLPTLSSWHSGEKLLQEINFVLWDRQCYDFNLDQE